MRVSLAASFLLCLGCAGSAASVAPNGSTVAEVAAHGSAPQRPAPTPWEAELRPILIKGVLLIDGSGGEPVSGQDVLLEAGRIAAVGTDLAAPDGAQVILARGRTLLPGFIDAHVHLTFTPPANFAEGVVADMKEHDADRALHGARNAAATLAAGFTTVRNVGGTFADRALRDAIARGDVAGPRMLVANYAITITGGHCDDTNGFHPDVLPDASDYRAGVADSPDEARRAVRYQLKHGADVIKLCATGGVMSQGDAVGVSQMTPAELEAAVDEAVRAERKVAAHAHGTQGIKDAIEAGVHSIEHGSVLDDEAIEMMRARGTVLVPTLSAGAHVVAAADAGRLSDETAAKAREIAPQMRHSFGRAYKAGVKIALGSDAGVFPHGRNGREFALMVGEGMTPMDAIVAGTASAAALLGLSDVGTIGPGQRADVVLVDGNPLDDISCLQSPAVVIQGGVVAAGTP